ncbi:MAG: hypothetical protein [Microviridae sp.]|nr:MAG: hypothetical protein [Microviridae sp.]
MQNKSPPKKMFCPNVAEPIKARGRQTAGLRPCISHYMFSNYHIHKNQLQLWPDQNADHQKENPIQENHHTKKLKPIRSPEVG